MSTKEKWTSEQAAKHLRKMLRNAQRCRREADQYVIDLGYYNGVVLKGRGEEPILVETIDEQKRITAEMTRLIPIIKEHLKRAESEST